MIAFLFHYEAARCIITTVSKEESRRRKWKVNLLFLTFVVLLMVAGSIITGCRDDGAASDSGDNVAVSSGTSGNCAPTDHGGKPEVRYFTASQGTIRAGEKATLSWDVSGSTEVSISPSNIFGPAKGSVAVSPSATTTYTLVARNAEGSTSASVTVSVAIGMIVGVDPVTGRNQDIDLIWEQLCLATDYQVQIAKDPAFTLMVWDTGVYTPSDSTSPTLILPPSSRFQAGQTYYIRWRVRGAATGEQITSPWSEVQQPLTIKQGFPVN